MIVRILLPVALQPSRRKSVEPELSGLESWMLPGENELRLSASCLQGMGDRCELDGFGAGADDQPNIRGLQSSPYLGGGNLPSVAMTCNRP